MPDVPMRPDDITDEEYAEFEREAKHVSVRYGLVGLNALRDERVRADERERIAREIEAMVDDARARPGCGPISLPDAYRLVLAAIREGGQHGE